METGAVKHNPKTHHHAHHQDMGPFLFPSFTPYTPSPDHKKILVGICCMDSKGYSKPMQNILTRVNVHGEFDIVFFGERLILEKPIEEWPEVDVLIAFFSNGFPLEKAIKYHELYPSVFSVNDLKSQHLFLDRREVYRVLKRNSLPVNRHLIMNRDGSTKEPTFVEGDNWIEIDGERLEKPFVEKPVSGEDHNIYIYYHENQGGGSRRLFRKIGNKSSEFYPHENRVRTTGSYIYEEFIDADGKEDMKIYTVGPHYSYAEGRKSPVVDGKVERDADGKEIRRVIDLTDEEKFIAYKVVKAFNQRICGFDILKKNGRCFISDVNGWSFVKGNPRFYDECARLLREMFLTAMKSKGYPILKPISGQRELRGLVAVFRHADRTPKQKIKFKVSNRGVLAFFGDKPKQEVKLKNVGNQAKLDKLLKAIYNIVSGSVDGKYDGVDAKDAAKLHVLISVLEGGYGGTKIQLKPLKHTTENGIEIVEKALLVCKWGGLLTHAGIKQSRALGHSFLESMLPANKEPFLENIQVMSNNERRVKRTAEEFCKAFLGKQLPKDLVQDNHYSISLLGDISAGKELMTSMKNYLVKMMHSEDLKEYLEMDIYGLKRLGNPLRTMREMHELMKKLHDFFPSNAKYCEGEGVKMIRQRWLRLIENFYDAQKDCFDTTKIPDIYDYIMYEVVHNRDPLVGFDLYPLYQKTEAMARFIVPEEYGVEPKDKFMIGSLICGPLVEKILNDLKEIASGSTSRTRLYFTRTLGISTYNVFSESHIHTLRNVLLHSGISKFFALPEPIELNYLTHLVFKLWENTNLPESDPNRFQIEMLMSPGTNDALGLFNTDHMQRIKGILSINDNLLISDLEKIVEKALKLREEHCAKQKEQELNVEK